jgi:NAD(P)-dependent dehydrogenase (short-subunit alcohol dehydrogenase family)
MIVFGGSGAIGGAVCAHLLGKGWKVWATSRSGAAPAEAPNGVTWLSCDVETKDGLSDLAHASERFDAAVWAQGRNLTDDVRTIDFDAHNSLYQSNVVFVLKTLKVLLKEQRLNRPARLCVVSSIWQNIARSGKMSYCITKSALQGLVQSAAADLGPEGHLINAVLPGALDTPMTRTNLTPHQIGALEGAAPLGRLPLLSDVCGLVEYLCSSANTGITGQFVAADAGFSYVRRF